MSEDNAWTNAWSSVDVATQVQNVTAFNGVGNVNTGQFTVGAEQGVGAGWDGGPLNDASVAVHVDTSNGVEVGVQVQTVAAFNGVGNVNAGSFLVGADQDVGAVEADWAALFGDNGGLQTGTQVQNVTAFNGVGNVNAGNFGAFAEQAITDAMAAIEEPSAF